MKNENYWRYINNIKTMVNVYTERKEDITQKYMEFQLDRKTREYVGRYEDPKGK